jgi:hypothetical protein
VNNSILEILKGMTISQMSDDSAQLVDIHG